MLTTLTQFTLLRAFANRSFLLLWSGQTVSRIGDFLYEIALAWWALEKTGSATAAAGVLIFSVGPMVVFSLIGGVAVDRYPRVQVMLASDVARAVLVSGVTVLAALDRLELWHVYVASLVFGVVDAFFQPAYMATVPDIVAEADLPSANSLTSLSFQLGRIVGPAIGGAVVAVGDTGLAFGVNALTFWISAVFLFPLRHLAQPSQPSEKSPGMLHELAEGIRTVAQLPWLWMTICLYALTNVALAGPYSVAMPFLVKEEWHANADTLGLVYAMFPIGYVVGSIWQGRKEKIRARGLFIYIGSAVAGLMLYLFGLPVPLWLLLVAAFINGFALEVGAMAWTTALQELVPRDKLGRVASIDAIGSFALLPVGFGLTGLAVDNWGAGTTFLVGGGATAFISAVLLLRSAIWKMD